MSTTSTQLTSVIPPERIEEGIRKANRTTPIALAIADADSVGQGLGNTVSIPKETGITIPSGTKSENAEFPVVQLGYTDQTGTAGTVGATFLLSRESSYDAIVTAFDRGARTVVSDLVQRVDGDGLDLILGSSHTQNYTGQDLTDARLLTALATFHAQKPDLDGNDIALAVPAIPLRDLGLDLTQSGAGYLGGDAESMEVRELLGPGLGFKGVRHGIRIFLSQNVPTTGNDANCPLVVMGGMSAWAYRSWRVIEVEDEYIPKKQAWEVTVSARYSWFTADDEQQLELVVDNVA